MWTDDFFATMRRFKVVTLADCARRLVELERDRDEARREVAQLKREGEKVLARAIESELREVRAMDKYRTERDRAHRVEKESATLRAENAKLRAVAEAAREVDRCIYPGEQWGAWFNSDHGTDENRDRVLTLRTALATLESPDA